MILEESQELDEELSTDVKDMEPCEDKVSLAVFEQVMRERDIAIEQLKDLGYEFGEKIEPCEDAISRQAALSKIDGIMALNHLHSQIPYFTPHRVKLILDELPPITPARPTGRWQQLKETIMEIKDNNKYDNDTATEICGFLLKYMRVLENEKEQI